MTIVVIGGTGLIGSKTVAVLRQGGHGVLAASAPIEALYPHFGITSERVSEAARSLV